MQLEGVAVAPIFFHHARWSFLRTPNPISISIYGLLIVLSLYEQLFVFRFPYISLVILSLVYGPVWGVPAAIIATSFESIYLPFLLPSGPSYLLPIFLVGQYVISVITPPTLFIRWGLGVVIGVLPGLLRSYVRPVINLFITTSFLLVLSAFLASRMGYLSCPYFFIFFVEQSLLWILPISIIGYWIAIWSRFEPSPFSVIWEPLIEGVIGVMLMLGYFWMSQILYLWFGWNATMAFSSALYYIGNFVWWTVITGLLVRISFSYGKFLGPPSYGLLFAH